MITREEDRLVVLHLPEGRVEEWPVDPRGLEAVLKRTRTRRVILVERGLQDLLEEVEVLGRGGHPVGLALEEALQRVEWVADDPSDPELEEALEELRQLITLARRGSWLRA